MPFRGPLPVKFDPVEFERIERLHDDQDTLLSKEERDKCNQLRAQFVFLSQMYDKKAFTMGFSKKEVSPSAELCFLYATRRIMEKPKVDRTDHHTIVTFADIS